MNLSEGSVMPQARRFNELQVADGNAAAIHRSPALALRRGIRCRRPGATLSKLCMSEVMKTVLPARLSPVTAMCTVECAANSVMEGSLSSIVWALLISPMADEILLSIPLGSPR
jgi:hypothetical protein